MLGVFLHVWVKICSASAGRSEAHLHAEGASRRVPREPRKARELPSTGGVGLAPGVDVDFEGGVANSGREGGGR